MLYLKGHIQSLAMEVLCLAMDLDKIRNMSMMVLALTLLQNNKLIIKWGLKTDVCNQCCFGGNGLIQFQIYFNNE